MRDARRHYSLQPCVPPRPFRLFSPLSPFRRRHHRRQPMLGEDRLALDSLAGRRAAKTPRLSTLDQSSAFQLFPHLRSPLQPLAFSLQPCLPPRPFRLFSPSRPFRRRRHRPPISAFQFCQRPPAFPDRVPHFFGWTLGFSARKLWV